MCLFNPDYLRRKVDDALLVLDASDDDPEPAPAAPAQSSAPPSSLPTSALSTSLPPIPPTLEALYHLPAASIAALLHADALRPLGLAPAPPAVRAATDAFMDSFEGRPAKDVKQALGTRVHAAVKGFRIKRSPTAIVRLLDREELRGLAHVADYAGVVRGVVEVELARG